MRPLLFVGLALFPLTAAAQQPAGPQLPKLPGLTKQGDVEPAFAFIALNDVQLATAGEIRKALDKYVPEPKAGKIEYTAPVIMVHRQPIGLAIALIPQPIPWRDLEGPCKTNWLWKEGEKTMKGHVGHLLVVANGGPKLSHLQRNLYLTKAVAALSEVHNTAGVFWGHGNVVLEPSFFRTEAAKATAKDPPVLLWTRCVAGRTESGGLTVFTEGFDYFGCLEIEIIDSQRSFPKLAGMVFDTGKYQLLGNKIADGDTIGSGDNEKIATRHAKSIVEQRKKKVLQIAW